MGIGVWTKFTHRSKSSSPTRFTRVRGPRETRSGSQKRKNRQDLTGKTNGWKNILNTLTVHYGDRIAANSIN